jgi:hypothetical protein
MRAQVLMGVHGCSWLFMRVYGCSCVFVCLSFCLLPSTFFELKKMNVRWRSQPWADFFVELSAIQGFEGAFFEISSGSSSFIKTNCQDWMAFHGCIQFFLQKINGQSSPDLINH